jgi:hypothetical protein
MEVNKLVTKPFSIEFNQCSVSAVIKFNQANSSWHVTVVINRRPGNPQIKGEEIDARLLSYTGVELKILERPKGQLYEAGGSLGVSTNVFFQFQSDSDKPSRLEVTYQGQTICFQLAK